MAEGIITRRGGGGLNEIIATGGTVTEFTSGGETFKVHTFTSTGTSTFEVLFAPSDATVDYVIVGSGGSGGSDRGGGGGGGFFEEGSGTVEVNQYDVVVGAAASGVFGTSFDSRNGNNGNPSSFLGVTANGGGRGFTTSGGSGGSGGGGGNNVNDNRPMNGGSNGSNGQNGSASGGTGQGPPTGSDISGTFTLFSGGGGGGGFTSQGSGGAGGGGNGGGGTGTPNTGGGGGGGRAAASSGASGSGIVIVRYRIG